MWGIDAHKSEKAIQKITSSLTWIAAEKITFSVNVADRLSFENSFFL